MVPLRQLSYLVAVADNGSISAAAKRLGISQPAISAAIVAQHKSLRMTNRSLCFSGPKWLEILV